MSGRATSHPRLLATWASWCLQESGMRVSLFTRLRSRGSGSPCLTAGRRHCACADTTHWCCRGQCVSRGPGFVLLAR